MADALSRQPVKTLMPSRNPQLGDPERLGGIRRSFCSMLCRLKFVQRTKNGWYTLEVVCPQQLPERILQKVHSQLAAGYPGIWKTIKRHVDDIINLEWLVMWRALCRNVNRANLLGHGSFHEVDWVKHNAESHAERVVKTFRERILTGFGRTEIYYNRWRNPIHE